jgi:predicted RNA-binding Zn ribbon-like protein
MDETIWLDLLNSDWRDHLGSGRREDRLDNPDWRRDYFARYGIETAGIPADRLVSSLRELRAAIRGIVDAYIRDGRKAAPDWEKINAYLGRAPLVRRVASGSPGKPPRLEFVSRAEKVESIVGRIGGAFAEAMSQGDPGRLKTCRNVDCAWVFYDLTKNRSRRWCEDTCGNLMKVRRFRAKRRGV